ncbi:MAG: response regulator [Candidatus Limivicinus sp.]|jgi:transcriptional regulator with XRE-family HTH domain
MDRSNHFGKRVRELRIKQNLTQQQLADQVFVARKTISNWESGIREPDVSMIGRVARGLHVDISELLEDSSAESAAPTIIVVEDEPVLLTGFIHVLENTLPDIQTLGFITAAEASRFAASTRVDIAFLDIELFGESGIELAGELQTLNPHTNIIFLTGHPEYAGEALKLHCSGYLLKPLTPDKIRAEISHLRYPVKGLTAT